MGEAALKQGWTWEEYVTWEQEQPEKYEFVGGQPRMMTGGNKAHSAIGINLTAYLRTALRGSQCRAYGPDLKVKTGLGTGRYPDALIDCAPHRNKDGEAINPVVVFEVLSQGSKATDFNDKLAEYDATPAIQQYVLVHQDQAKVVVWRRVGTGRFTQDEIVEGLDASIDLAAGIAIGLRDIYEDIEFGERGATV
jgi:Uma2 family endonuclease